MPRDLILGKLTFLDLPGDSVSRRLSHLSLPGDMHPDPGTPGSQVATVLGRIGFPGGAEVKASACNMRELGSIPGSGRSLGEGNGNPLQYSMDGGAWWATIHGL